MPTPVLQEDVERCLSMQGEEWEVLQSIYPECVSSDLSTGLVKLEIPIELSEPAIVTSRDEGSRGHGSPKETNPTTALPSLSTLPPLLIDIILPPTYPLCSPPTIVSLYATYSWLPTGVGLRQRLLNMWQEGEGVLYTWVEWIRSAEFLESLELISTLDGVQIIRIPHPALDLLMPRLISYDSSMQLARFSQNSYTCEICLSSIKGVRCILLSCSHIFCRTCLEDFWRLCITEGDVGRVGCPDPQCVKESREANEEEVRRVVSEAEVMRWRWLRQKRALEKDPTMIHCPMSFCQAAVLKPANVEEGSGWERLRTCPECDYSFCAYCRRTWHGPLSECPLSVTEGFILEYINSPEGSDRRERIESRYGRANVRRLVARYQEDQANRKWIQESTMECPSCHIHVEKSLGCNHMTCAKCQQHFCYRCGEKLHPSNPYDHFSTAGRRCFNKLFDVAEIEDDWQPVEGFEALE